jgi:hypothetical protein
MTILSDYVSGTISLANGSVTVTGTGTLFEVTQFREGDTLQIQNLTAVIASVDSNTQLTLAEPWTGASIVNGAYRARQLGDGSRVSTQAATIIELLGNGVLMNLAELGVEEGKAPVGGPTGEYELVDLVQDPNGSLASLAALTLAARRILQTDASGALKQVALAANKFLRTDANGDLALSDLTNAIASFLALAPAANQLAYFDTPNSAALTSLTALARTFLGSATGSAMWAAMGATGSLGNPGYLTLPNGVKIQWGNTSNTATTGVATIMYPSAFTTFAVPVFVNGDTNAYGYAPMGFRVGTNGQFTTYFPGGTSATVRICWIAIGV